jgi:hypothetical protein
MLMVILGAGASYDAINEIVHGNVNDGVRPPLSEQLVASRSGFSAAALRHPPAVAAIDELRRAVGGGRNLEAQLAVMQARAARSCPPGKLELAALRYYIRDVVGACSSAVESIGFTNHLQLVRTIEQWRYGSDDPVLYVTFNYDTILERALADVLGLSMKNLDSYVGNRHAHLYKLHGSTNWWHKTGRWIRALDGHTAEAFAIANLADLDIRGEYVKGAEAFGEEAQRSAGDMVEVRFPAIAIPVEEKPHFELPPHHEAKLRELLPSVNHVISVGWRGAETHFMDLLAASWKDHKSPIHGITATHSEPGAIAVRGRLHAAGVDTWSDSVFSSADRSSPAGAFSRLVGSPLESFLDGLAP